MPRRVRVFSPHVIASRPLQIEGKKQGGGGILEAGGYEGASTLYTMEGNGNRALPTAEGDSRPVLSRGERFTLSYIYIVFSQIERHLKIALFKVLISSYRERHSATGAFFVTRACQEMTIAPSWE